MRRLLLILSIFSVGSLFGQSIYINFEPLPRTVKKNELIDEFTTRRQNLFKIFSSTDHKSYGSSVEHAYKYYVESLEKGYYLVDSSNTARIKKIFDQIVKANDLPIGDELILIRANPYPNANVGMLGIIEVTTGLLSIVENDDELAFVLGHEITHYLEGHLYKTIDLINQSNVESSIVSELEKIRRGRGTLDGLNKAQDKYYLVHRFNRQNEYFCDSVSVGFIKNAGFDSKQAYSCIQKLGLREFEFEQPFGEKLLSQLFTEKYPMKAYWLKEKLSLYNKMPTYQFFFISDSIRTHPENDKRAAAILRIVDTTGVLEKKRDIDLAYSFENIQSAYTSGELDICLFLTLKMRLKYPDNVFLKSMIVKVFLKIYQARIDQTPDSHPDMLVNNYTIEYGDDLKMINHFLNNITKEESLEIAYHYLNNPKTFNSEAEDHYNLLSELCELTGRTALRQKIVSVYNQKFPQGVYILK